MKNYVQGGSSLEWTNGTGSAVVSGDVVVVGNQIGVAAVDIADTESGTVNMEGVFTLPKVSAAVIAQGEDVIYDVSAAAFDDNAAVAAAGDVSGACTAWAAGADGETTLLVKINTGVGSVT